MFVITDAKHLSAADALVEGDVLFVTGTAAGVSRSFPVPAFKLDDNVNINVNGLTLASVEGRLVDEVMKASSVTFL